MSNHSAVLPASLIRVVGHLWVIVFLILCGAIFLNFPGTRSVAEFLQWADNAAQYGLVKGFAANHADYPPLCSIALYGVDSIAKALSISTFIGIKISLLAALLATAFSFWLLTRSKLLTVVVYLMLIPDSMMLTTLDVYFLPWLLLALWALQKHRWVLFSFLYTIACLIKWQPLIIAPFIAVYLLKQWRRQGDRATLKPNLPELVLPGGILAAICLFIYNLPLLQAFYQATNNPYLSGNALNFHWILTYAARLWWPEFYGALEGGEAHYLSLHPHSMVPFLLKGFFWVVYASTLYLYHRGPESFLSFLRFSILGYLAYFTFALGVHENHLALAAVLGLVLTSSDREYLWSAFALCLIFNINLFVFQGWNGSGLGVSRVIGIDVTVPLAGLVVVFFGILFAKSIAPVVPNVMRPKDTS